MACNCNNDNTAITINIKTAPHEQLDELLGGDDSGHFHLTEDEYNLMLRLVEQLQDEDETEQEFHKLNDDEYTKLSDMFSIFYPDDDEDADFEQALNAIIDARVAQYVAEIIDGGKVGTSTDIDNP